MSDVISTTEAKNLCRKEAVGVPADVKAALDEAGYRPARGGEAGSVTLWYKSDIKKYIARRKANDPTLTHYTCRARKPQPDPVAQKPTPTSVDERLSSLAAAVTILGRKIDALLEALK